jgi:hypothetical protein
MTAPHAPQPHPAPAARQAPLQVTDTQVIQWAAGAWGQLSPMPARLATPQAVHRHFTWANDVVRD